jgi:hypothetical protein
MSDKQLTDQLVSSLKPLADLNFELDLLYECRQLHNSLMQLGQNAPSAANTRTSVCMKKLAGRYRRVETGIEYRKTSGEDSRATNVAVVV